MPGSDIAQNTPRGKQRNAPPVADTTVQQQFIIEAMSTTPPEPLHDPSGTEDPLSDQEIQALRQEIDRLDAEILAAIKRRSEVSRMIGRTRMASGGTRLVHTRELKVYERFSELGEEGRMLAQLLLRLGRGRLG